MKEFGKSKWIAAALAVTAGTGVLFGAEVLKIEKASDLLGTRNLTENAAEKSITASGRYARVTSKPFPVDPAKKYKLSGKFRAAPGTAGEVFYFGFIPLDEKGRQIASEYVNVPKKGTDTELAAPARKGDTVVKVKDASKWDMLTPWGVIAFNAKDDCSDLPNRDVTQIAEKKIEKKGDVWEVTLKKPVAKDYPAGTRVRQQRFGATYLYTAGPGKKAPADWQEFSGNVQGIVPAGNPSYKWWNGTKQAQILVIMNYATKDGKTEFKDIVLETID